MGDGAGIERRGNGSPVVPPARLAPNLRTWGRFQYELALLDFSIVGVCQPRHFDTVDATQLRTTGATADYEPA
jgi:hypothetical protein